MTVLAQVGGDVRGWPIERYGQKGRWPTTGRRFIVLYFLGGSPCAFLSSVSAAPCSSPSPRAETTARTPPAPAAPAPRAVRAAQAPREDTAALALRVALAHKAGPAVRAVPAPRVARE